MNSMPDRKRGHGASSVERQQTKRKKKPDKATGNALQLRKKQLSLIRRKLPVYQHKNEICKLVTDNEAVLVVAETVCCFLTCLHLKNARFGLVWYSSLISVPDLFLKQQQKGKWKINTDTCVSLYKWMPFAEQQKQQIR